MEKVTHTEGEWSFHAVHPMDIEDGVVTTHWDQPPKLFAVKTTFYADYPRHGKNLRTTVYIADAHITHGRAHQAEANARLLAASPALLEACNEAFDFLGGIDGASAIRVKLLAAIMKATAPAAR